MQFNVRQFTDRLLNLYDGSTADAQAWLACQHPLLDNQAPIDCLRTDAGTARVLDLIERLEQPDPEENYLVC